MGKLLKLKEWLTLDEASVHISNVIGKWFSNSSHFSNTVFDEVSLMLL